MKRRAFLFAILSIFTLTSCDFLSNMMPQTSRRRRSSEESQLIDKSNESSNINTSRRHSHVWEDWMELIPATCTEQGLQRRRCMVEGCDEFQERTTQALGHDYQFLYSYAASCYEEGTNIYRCTRCQVIAEQTIPASHSWIGPAYYVPSQEGYVGYDYFYCANCTAKKIEISALNGTLAEGSTIKTGTPNGYMKLNSNNQSISWTFNNVKGAMTGMLYQRGTMDAYSSNTTRTYGNYTTTSSTATRAEGNFTITVNGNVVDKSRWINTPYSEFLDNGSWDSNLDETYSPVADCPIGQCYIQNGVNTIVFTRTGSFNLSISHLVLVFDENDPAQHVHQASSNWFADEDGHWHECVAPNCPVTPAIKLDYSEHTFGERYDEVPSTCSVKGSYKMRCQVCGFVRTYETETTEHDWRVDETYPVVQPSKTTSGSQTMRCSVCHQIKQVSTVYGETKETALTVDEAVAVGQRLEVGSYTEQVYFIRGYISKIQYAPTHEDTGTLWLASSSKAEGFQCYRTSVDSSVDLEQIAIGSEVLATGKIHRYKEDIVEIYNNSKILEATYVEHPITALSFGSYAFEMPVNTSRILDLQIQPIYGNEFVTWTVSSLDHIDFDFNQKKVTAKSEGEVVIQAIVDKNNDGLINDGEIYATLTIRITNPDLFYNSVNLLDYTGDINIGYESTTACQIGYVFFRLSGVGAYTSNQGALRFRPSTGTLTATNFQKPITKIVIETYNSTAYQYGVCVGANGEQPSDEPLIYSSTGVYHFDAELGITAFSIKNTSTSIIMIQSISVYLEGDDIPLPYDHEWYGSLPLVDSNNYLPMWLTFTSYDGKACLRYSNEPMETGISFTYNSKNCHITVYSSLLGTFTCTYNADRDRIESLKFLNNEIAGLFKDEGTYLVNEKKVLWCDGSTEELQQVFKRRYNNPWQIDTNNADRITPDTDKYVSGECGLKLRPWADGRVALATNDFDEPFYSSKLSFWVYNSGSEDITIQVFIYREPNLSNYIQAQCRGGGVLKAGEWTYVHAEFLGCDAYAFQVYIPNHSSPLTFDEFVLR